MRSTGRLVRFDIDSGYGFASCPDSDDVFVHVNSFVERPPESMLRQGAEIEFDIVEGDRGNRAENVMLVKAASGSGLSLRHELLDALLDDVPSLTGNQLKDVVAVVENFAADRGWS